MTRQFSERYYNNSVCSVTLVASVASLGIDLNELDIKQFYLHNVFQIYLKDFITFESNTIKMRFREMSFKS